MKQAPTSARIVTVRFRNYKALRDFTIRLKDANILVGPNNAGKSTLIGAFRALAVALRRMRGKKPDIVTGPNGRRYGLLIPAESLPISVENVHTDYSDEDSLVMFTLSNGNELQLYFPRDGSCLLIAETRSVPLMSSSAFQQAFPILISVVPVLGPVEHKEELVQAETVQRNLVSHRASRNFRNYWYHFPEGFEEFAELIAQTWSGIEIDAPNMADHSNAVLAMFCKEQRILREIYWVGSGFQIWCQLLTHLIRARGSSLIVIDEPEIYLHADLQRQLIGLLRSFDADILLATHSTEIMGEAEPTDLVLVNKLNKTGERIKSVEKLQSVLSAVGSIHNVTLSRIARSRKVLFVEGDKDFRIVRMIARQCGLNGLSAGLEIVPTASDGFGSWEKVAALGWGISKALDDQIAIGALYDRDYFPDAQIEYVQQELSKSLAFAHIHQRKEIENYLLIPVCLNRAITNAIADRAKRDGVVPSDFTQIEDELGRITDRYREDVSSNVIGKEIDYKRSSGHKQDSSTLHSQASAAFSKKWNTLEDRLKLVPGKAVLSDLRAQLAEKFGITLTDAKIVSSMRIEDIPPDLAAMLYNLERFRTSSLTG